MVFLLVCAFINLAMVVMLVVACRTFEEVFTRASCVRVSSWV